MLPHLKLAISTAKTKLQSLEYQPPFRPTYLRSITSASCSNMLCAAAPFISASTMFNFEANVPETFHDEPSIKILDMYLDVVCPSLSSRVFPC